MVVVTATSGGEVGGEALDVVELVEGLVDLAGFDVRLFALLLEDILLEWFEELGRVLFGL